MKFRLLATAALVAGLAGAPALAQPDEHGDHGGGQPGGEAPHNGGGAPHGPGGGAPHDMGGPHQNVGSRPSMSPAPQMRAPDRGPGADTGMRGPGGGERGSWSGAARPQAESPNRGGQPNWNGRGPGHGGAGPQATPGGRGPTPRGSVSARGGHFTFQGRTVSRMHAPAFHYPGGYGYRRWSVGSRLPRLFLNPMYYFTGYDEFGFGPPPFGEQWVRYGPDLLLVDIDSGEIDYVIYGAFY
jgi:Ni/Co efflux regulator RcnB